MRSFLGFGQVPYIGQPSAQAIKLGGIAGAAIPLLFQWLSYGASSSLPNINVLVDISQKVCAPVDQIRSIYIDNLGSDNPVYVYFPDTQYTLAAKPNSEGWYPVFTNARQMWVCGEGFLTGNIPQTGIIISNIPMPASVNTEIDNAVALWKASPSITRGLTIYNSAFGSPALGDQFFASALLDMGSLGATANLWNTPYASGFLYITDLQVVALNVTGAPGTGAFVIESTGVAGILASVSMYAPVTVNQNNAPVFQTRGQIKLDATQTWRLRVSTNVGNGSRIQSFASFTQNPN